MLGDGDGARVGLALRLGVDVGVSGILLGVDDITALGGVDGLSEWTREGTFVGSVVGWLVVGSFEGTVAKSVAIAVVAASPSDPFPSLDSPILNPTRKIRATGTAPTITTFRWWFVVM